MIKAIEGLHHPYARQVFPGDAVHFVEALLDFPEERKTRVDAQSDQTGHDRDHHEQDQRHPSIQNHRHHNPANGKQRSLHEDPHGTVHEVLYLSDIIGQPRHQ